MKKFEQALLEAEKQNSLKRVKLKLDPKIREAQDYSQYEGYEGYVLSETETHIELQIKDKRVTLPKVVLENKLRHFIRGAMPGTYASYEKAKDKVDDAKNYYWSDPNVTGAEKFGRATGSIVKGLSKAANPMTVLKGVENIMTTPARLIGGALGINNQKEQEPKNFGNIVGLKFVSSTQQNLGQTLCDSALKFNKITHTVSTSKPDDPIKYYTIKDEAEADYMLVGAEKLSQFAGGNRYSSKHRMPIGSISYYSKTAVDTINQLKGQTPIILDDSFFNALQQINDELNNQVNHDSSNDKNKKHQYSVTMLHIPSLKIFEIDGYLMPLTHIGGGFDLSEKPA